jgi:hypothetical protein
MIDSIAAPEHLMMDGTFAVYVGALCLSGILLLVIAALGLGQTMGMRVLDAVIGVAFLGYGGYLALIFNGDEYMIFFYAFILPVMLIVRVFRNRAAVGVR